MKYIQFSTAAMICLLLLSTFIVSPAQTISNAQSGCSRIDQSHLAQFISYESVSDSGVRLRLHNNSTCPIIVETDDRAPLLLGNVRSIALHYLVQNRQRQTVKPAYGWGDSVFAIEILAGDSITFSVPLEHFRKRLDVAAPFIYSWEGNHVGAGFIGGVNHYVYFLVDDIPAGILRRRYREQTRHNNSFNRSAD
ncbi:MAG: hypothetical protein M3362_20665 [Acidobacteriota bacterium]|nr:hypothetical protein [Acidobacteriota bacterium]